LADYENYEDVDQSYGQNILSGNKMAKIVSPTGLNRRGFDSIMASRRFNRREENPDTPKEKKSLPDKKEKKDNNISKPEASKASGGGIRNVLKSFSNNKKKMKAVETVVKVKKVKWILIGVAVFFGMAFVLIIGFAVLTGGGSAMTGMAFNEVSEYELSQDDTDNSTNSSTNDSTTEEKLEVIKPSEEKDERMEQE